MVDWVLSIEFFLVSIFLITSIFLFEFLTRKLSIKPSISRKIIHVFGASSVAILSFFLDFKIFILMAPIIVLVLVYGRHKKFQSLSDRSDKSYGEILFPIGVLIAALIAPSNYIFASAMFVVGISDTAAFFVGKNIKSIKLILNKTLIGSLAFFVSSLMILLLFIDFKIAILVALLASSVELISPNGTDNVTVPLVVSAILAINL